jgi:hypothetical protein
VPDGPSEPANRTTQVSSVASSRYQWCPNRVRCNAIDPDAAFCAVPIPRSPLGRRSPCAGRDPYETLVIDGIEVDSSMCPTCVSNRRGGVFASA